MKPAGINITLSVDQDHPAFAALARAIAIEVVALQAAAANEATPAVDPDPLDAIDPTQLYPINEGAKILHKAPSTMWRWRAEKRLETVTIGRNVYIEGRELRRHRSGGAR